MRILLTGAGSNLGSGLVERLADAGHDLVLSDLNALPDRAPYSGREFHQCDVQAGFGLEKAAEGCDLVLHTPAWHGMHSRVKTEVDFWRLNVDGTFWMLQAARSAGISRFVFISSMSWFGHYEKYGFTKRVGEELCEYHRRENGLRYVTVRPHDFTPWGTDFLRYGARLLYGGVDREDVLDCVVASVDHLAGEVPADGPEGHIVHAVRANAFTEEQVQGWSEDPHGTCEAVFPGSADLLRRHPMDIAARPSVVEPVGAAQIGYRPTRHFGTFLQELAELDAKNAVPDTHCPY